MIPACFETQYLVNTVNDVEVISISINGTVYIFSENLLITDFAQVQAEIEGFGFQLDKFEIGPDVNPESPNEWIRIFNANFIPEYIIHNGFAPTPEGGFVFNQIPCP